MNKSQEEIVAPAEALRMLIRVHNAELAEKVQSLEDFQMTQDVAAPGYQAQHARILNMAWEALCDAVRAYRIHLRGIPAAGGPPNPIDRVDQAVGELDLWKMELKPYSEPKPAFKAVFCIRADVESLISATAPSKLPQCAAASDVERWVRAYIARLPKGQPVNGYHLWAWMKSRHPIATIDQVRKAKAKVIGVQRRGRQSPGGVAVIDMGKLISLDDMRERVGRAIFGSDWLGGVSDGDWALIKGPYGIKQCDRNTAAGIRKLPTIKRCSPTTASRLDRAIGRAARSDAQYCTVDSWIEDHELPLNPAKPADLKTFDASLCKEMAAVSPPPQQTGPKPKVLPRVMAAMQDDLDAGRLTFDELAGMLLKELASTYGAAISTVREARTKVLAKQLQKTPQKHK